MPEHTPAPTPARSLYGFFMYLFSKTMLVIYCIWAITPDSYLHYFNIYYYPLKYWSVAIPIQCLVALTIYAFFIYPSLSLLLTTSVDSINTITDPHAQYVGPRIDNQNNTAVHCICSDVHKCAKNAHITCDKGHEENMVPQLVDLDIRFVCKKLYRNNHNY